MTPRALSWLGKRYRQREKRQEYFSALICSTLVNYSTRKLDEPSTPADFMHIDADRDAGAPAKRKGRKEIANLVRETFGKLPGVTFIPGE